MWDETGLDGSVWPDLAGKRNPSSNRDHPDRFRGLKRLFSAGFWQIFSKFSAFFLQGHMLDETVLDGSPR